jgi:hypothetical protein
VPWPALAGVGRYASIVDNEWTVVALLTSSPAASTEEPSIQHVSAPAPSPDGPFQVLQQGTTELLAPAERPGHPEAPCAASAWSRDRIAVHLPAGRVVYLGVTFPGMDVRARVAAVVLDRPGITMRRASPLVVELTGMVTGRQYTVPATGPGGTLLFGLTPAGVLPSETYRFAIAAPGVRGERYLYACVGS